MVLHHRQAWAPPVPVPRLRDRVLSASAPGPARIVAGRGAVAPRLLGWLLLGLLAAPVLAAPNLHPRGQKALAAAGSAAPGSALPDSTEYELKAAFLYKFIMYTEWPKESFSGPKDPIVVQLIGKDPFHGKLAKTFQGKKLHGRTFSVRHSVSVPKAVSADVVFAGTMSDQERKTLLARCKGKAVLLVGDTTDFASAGAIINMYLEKEKVRFEINPTAAKASSLKISSQLLKLARIVGPKKEGERR